MNISTELSLSETRERLRRWGVWCQIILNGQHKFSSKSLLAQLKESRGTIIHATNDSSIPDDIEAEEIDELVNQLGRNNIEMARVLYSHYASSKNAEQKAKQLQLSRATYFRYLQSAEKEISNKLFS